MVFEHLRGETLTIPKFLLKICLIWPPDRRKIGALITFAVSSTMKVLTAIPLLMDVFGNPSIPAIVKLIYKIFTILRGLSFWINIDRLNRLIKSKNEKSSSIKNLRDRRIMRYHKTIGKTFFFGALTFPFLARIILEIIVFPYSPYDKRSENQEKAQKDHYTYDVMLAITRLLMNLFGYLEEVGFLLLFWSLSMHLSMEFKILKDKFHKFLRIKCKERSDKKFRYLVDRHNQLLDLCDDLKNAFFIFLTVTVLQAQIWTCDKAYQLAIGMNNRLFIRVIILSTGIGMSLWKLFILSKSGELLSTCSEEIADVFYQCKWYNFSKKSKTQFAIVILRCQKPVKLTVGGLFTLNHSNYRTIVDTLYSYFSLVLAITEPD